MSLLKIIAVQNLQRAITNIPKRSEPSGFSSVSQQRRDETPNREGCTRRCYNEFGEFQQELLDCLDYCDE